MDGKIENIFQHTTEDERAKALTELWIRLINETEYAKAMPEGSLPFRSKS